MEVTQRLFVYGSLAPGRPNEHLLMPLAGAGQPATVKGQLKQQGWRAAMGFPGLVPDKDGEELRGAIFSSELLADFWPTLDEFEGGQYERVLLDVRLDDGNSVAAFASVLK